MNTPTKVGRLMTMTARPGLGNDLAAALVAVADGLRDFPGCEAYLVTDQPHRVDLVPLGGVGLPVDRKRGSASNVTEAP